MELLLEAVLVIAGAIQSIVTIYRANLLWARYRVADIEAYADEHSMSVDAIRNSSRLAFGIQATFTILYWLALYVLVFR